MVPAGAAKSKKANNGAGVRPFAATIAEEENLAERHVRFLAPLAFLSPRMV
jgi:hypothetical protein